MSEEDRRRFAQVGGWRQGQPRRPAADGPGVIQVVILPPLQAPLRAWLASRGHYLYPLPAGDDLPTFGVGTLAPGETP